jgi:hypothetical protein
MEYLTGGCVRRWTPVWGRLESLLDDVADAERLADEVTPQIQTQPGRPLALAVYP